MGTDSECGHEGGGGRVTCMANGCNVSNVSNVSNNKSEEQLGVVVSVPCVHMCEEVGDCHPMVTMWHSEQGN